MFDLRENQRFLCLFGFNFNAIDTMYLKKKLNLTEFGNHFILNSTEIKPRGEKISKLIDHNLLSRNPFSNGVIEKSLQQFVIFRKVVKRCFGNWW